MKVVHLSHSDLFGGAARSAYNIHKSFIAAGIESRMIVINKVSKEKSIIEYNANKLKIINKLKNYLLIIFSKIFFDGNSSFNIFPNPGLVNFINSLKFDFVLIHWVHAEMLSIEDIRRLNKKKIFVLHDMWWINDFKHYFNENINFKNQISNSKFISNFMLNRKKKINMKNIVTPSQWMLDCSKKFLGKYNINFKKISYALDINTFKPVSKKIKKKKIDLLFIGFGKLDQKRKGIDLLVDILKQINSQNIQLTVIGDIDEEIFSKLNLEIRFIKRLTSNKLLSQIYSRSDILLFTSRQDNYPNVVMEALSTGLPIISFNVGGSKDMIKNNYNGYLCKPFNKKDFILKLKKLISSKKLRKKFSYNGRLFAKKNFNYKTVGKIYLRYLKDINNDC